jgi:hypothetical protein
MNVPGKIQKSRSGLRSSLNDMPVCYLVLFLFPALLLTGCSTAVTYKPNLPAGLARPVGYPVPVYTERDTVPRPCQLIGTVSIGGDQFAMFGGSVESEMKKMMQTAWEKGADAVQITSVEQPGFSRSNYRLTANLLRYADVWETVPVSAEEFTACLATNQQQLDPIEGVWEGDEIAPLRVGIMRNTSKPGRDLIGFILNVENPAWHKGYKKIDIQRGDQPGSYIFDYYLDNFGKRKTTVILGQSTTFSLMIPTSEEAPDFITYSKIR